MIWRIFFLSNWLRCFLNLCFCYLIMKLLILTFHNFSLLKFEPWVKSGITLIWWGEFSVGSWAKTQQPCKSNIFFNFFIFDVTEIVFADQRKSIWMFLIPTKNDQLEFGIYFSSLSSFFKPKIFRKLITLQYIVLFPFIFALRREEAFLFHFK